MCFEQRLTFENFPLRQFYLRKTMLIHIFLLLSTRGVLAHAVTLVGRVSSGGVEGNVTFTQDNPGDTVAVTFSLNGSNAANVSSWQLHEYRLHYDVGDDRCSASRLGARIASTVGGPATAKNVTGIELTGIHSIEGRSVALLKTGGSEPFACATVESLEDYLTARTTFRKGALGVVTFRQLGSSATSLTRVTADLYSGGSTNTARSVEWRVVEGGCSSVGTAYNPNTPTGTCNTTNHNSCAIGDLNGKLGTVTVGVTRGTSRMTSVDLNLPLSGGQSVVGKSLQLIPTGQTTGIPFACATISLFVTRTGVANFHNDGVTGTITLTQSSPLDPTFTRVDLMTLRSLAGGYHVHKWPVPQRVANDQEPVCGGPSVSGHFNPFGVDYTATPAPSAGTSTEDMYEVGDLSGKYGLLNGQEAVTDTFRDFNLPLFGVHSVLGRSLVIHKDLAGGPRWVCTNIRDTAALTFALATFTFPVIGHVMLSQRVGEAESETSVYVRLDYGDGNTSPTTGHSWAVHVRPASSDMLAANPASRCATAGDVYNPTTVSDNNYSTECQPSASVRCKLGDLAGKHGAVSVRKGPALPAIAFFTDTSLPLQGAHSVLGLAVVLRGAGGSSGILACSNLHTVWPLHAAASSWGSGANYGSVTFTQQVGVIAEPTTISFALRSLPTADITSPLVEARPVHISGTRCDDLGAAFNPFQADGTGTTLDGKPVGDLAGKFVLPLGPTVLRNFTDTNLDLWGYRAITGRALTLTSSGTKLACADVTSKPTSEGKLFTAVAKFTGPVTGTIKLSQVVYPRGATTPTTVTVDLRMAEGPQTQNHNWHVHEKVVGDDATADQGRCNSTGGHYNPFMVNVKNNYTECSPANPLRCELGDQSNKLDTYTMGSGPVVFSDSFLPLDGQFGVVGRSFVVHKKNRDDPRLACADILPTTQTDTLHMTIRTPSPLNKSAVIEKIAMTTK
ncbi:uncharacterized protein [Littorina saxatilis]|uniref:uncharacterized protein isoform X2 n=1 Tax=Littorina saxatilis TaxID=31220 RepID=UPI0038B634F1